jgi:hypothetical protein
VFGPLAELVFGAALVLLRYEPNPGREIPSRSKRLGITNARDQSRRQCGADTRKDLVEAGAVSPSAAEGEPQREAYERSRAFKDGQRFALA